MNCHARRTLLRLHLLDRISNVSQKRGLGPRTLSRRCAPQDFLNGVCTHIIWLTQNRLTYYTGNYDTYVKTVQENEVIQQKKHEREQDDIKHIKQFIASCGARAPRAALVYPYKRTLVLVWRRRC